MYEKLLSMIINSDSDISMCQFARFKEENSPDYTYLNDCVVKDKDTILKEVLIEKIGNHVCDKLFKRRLFDNNLFTKINTLQFYIRQQIIYNRKNRTEFTPKTNCL